jgi:hypothetical protein
MLFGKRKKYHNEVANALFEIMPTINSRDLDLFRVLMKFQIDLLYKDSAPPQMAAFSLAVFWYPEIVTNLKNGDASIFKYLGPYAGWLGACAKCVLEETSFLDLNDSEELRQRMATWYDIPFPLDQRHSIGGIIDEHVKMKNLMS